MPPKLLSVVAGTRRLRMKFSSSWEWVTSKFGKKGVLDPGVIFSTSWPIARMCIGAHVLAQGTLLL